MAKKDDVSPPSKGASDADAVPDAIAALALLKGWYAPRMIHRLEFLRYQYANRGLKDKPEFVAPAVVEGEGVEE